MTLTLGWPSRLVTAHCCQTTPRPTRTHTSLESWSTSRDVSLSRKRESSTYQYFKASWMEWQNVPTGKILKNRSHYLKLSFSSSLIFDHLFHKYQIWHWKKNLTMKSGEDSVKKGIKAFYQIWKILLFCWYSNIFLISPLNLNTVLREF